MSKFLERIQSSDDATKKRWIVVGTAFAMILVFVLWFGYFGTLLRPAPPLQPDSGSSDQRSFLEVMRDGFGSLSKSFGAAISNGVSRLRGPTDYIITPDASH